MKLTTLDSLSEHLLAVMLPALQTASSSIRAETKNHLAKMSPPAADSIEQCWLLWQLLWIFAGKETHAVGGSANETPETRLRLLRDTLKLRLNNPLLKNSLQGRWMNSFGLPGLNAEENFAASSEETSSSKQKSFHHTQHPAQVLRKLLEDSHADKTQQPDNALALLNHFLSTYTGLGAAQLKKVNFWIDEFNSNKGVLTSQRPALALVTEYSWLDFSELKDTLLQSNDNWSVCTQKEVYCIELPLGLNRPISWQLCDGSAWLGWPARIGKTGIHPTHQRALACHPSEQNSTETASAWESEKSAIQSEWNALNSFIVDLPAKQAVELKNRWWADNFALQKQIFLEDWRAFSEAQEDNSRENQQKTTEPTEFQLWQGGISLPFMSALYALACEDLHI